MEFVTGLHVQQSELVFGSGHSVRVAVDCLEVVEHVFQVVIGVQSTFTHSESDVLV